MTSERRLKRLAPQYGRGIIAAGMLAFLLIAACSSNKKQSYQPVGSLFPLSKGNTWVFMQSGTGIDTLLDSIWINYDSVRTGTSGMEHWYSIRGTSFFGGRNYWIHRDSIGDLWCRELDFSSLGPFLLPSKVEGEAWLFRRGCARSDTVSLTDTAYTMYIPAGDLLQHVWLFSAQAACAIGDWKIFLARNYGPVGWVGGTTGWNLLRYRVKDDSTGPVDASPGYLLNPN